jgi:hypothetical protein
MPASLTNRNGLIKTALICSLILSPAALHAQEGCRVEKPHDGCLTSWDADGTHLEQTKIPPVVSNHAPVTATETHAEARAVAQPERGGAMKDSQPCQQWAGMEDTGEGKTDAAGCAGAINEVQGSMDR